jgi:hypothetical protein
MRKICDVVLSMYFRAALGFTTQSSQRDFWEYRGQRVDTNLLRVLRLFTYHSVLSV